MPKDLKPELDLLRRELEEAVAAISLNRVRIRTLSADEEICKEDYSRRLNEKLHELAQEANGCIQQLTYYSEKAKVLRYMIEQEEKEPNE